MTPSIHRLKRIFEKAWTRETSSDPDWSPENPALGQCAVTACVVQDVIGGDIVWCDVALPGGKTVSHYFNRVNGQDVDLTRQQFPQGAVVPEGQPKTRGHATTRDYVLSFDATRQRYDTLAAKVRLMRGRGQ